MVGPDLKPNCKVLFFKVEREERRGDSEIKSEKDVLFGHIDQFWGFFFFLRDFGLKELRTWILVLL